MSKRAEYKRKIKSHIKDLEKRGIDINSVTKGKSVDQLSTNIKTYNNFMNLKKRSLEKARDVKNAPLKFEKDKKKLYNKVVEQIKKSKIDKKSKSILATGDFKKLIPHFTDFKKIDNKVKLNTLKNNINKKSFKDISESITKKQAQNFLKDSYFQTFKAYEGAGNRIDNLIQAFGNNISKLNDFIEEVTADDFKVYTDDFESKYDDIDGYEEMMYQRLEKMEFILSTKYKLKI